MPATKVFITASTIPATIPQTIGLSFTKRIIKSVHKTIGASDTSEKLIIDNKSDIYIKFMIMYLMLREYLKL